MYGEIKFTLLPFMEEEMLRKGRRFFLGFVFNSLMTPFQGPARQQAVSKSLVCNSLCLSPGKGLVVRATLCLPGKGLVTRA